MAADTASLSENTTPAPRRFGWLRRFLRFLVNPRRRLTRAEQREIDAEKLARARQKSNEAGLQMEAELYAGQISEKLKDLGVCYEYKKADGGFARWKLVNFMRPYVIREEAIYLKADLRPGRSPRGIGVEELSQPRVVENLAIAVGHPVMFRYTPEKGFWYIVERELGKRGIPTHVKFDDMLAQRPASADGLALPLGVGADKRIMWRSLSQMYSMLIAGTTGGGKSNEINAMICALLRFNSPRKLRLVLVDLKGGVEFTFFAGVPHLMPVSVGEGKEAAIIERREQVIPALEWLIVEGERRLELLKNERAKSIGQYNFHNRAHPLAHIVLVVDEWADVKLEPKLGARAEELLINISSRFRAVGIHVLLCTQVPNKEVVSIRVKNVLPARLAFACPNVHTSMLIVGTGAAAGLEPAGRAIFDWGQGTFEIQTPYINNETVDATVAQAIRGEFDDVEPAAHDVTDQEVYEWSVNTNAGYLAVEEVFGRFRLRGLTKEYAAAFCKRAEGQTVMVGTTAYQIMAAAGALPRRLLPVEVADESAEPVKTAEPVTMQEVAAWSLAHNSGKLQARAVWEAFRERGLSKSAAEAVCKGSEGQVLSVGGVDYRVSPAARVPGRGMHPRQLVTLDGSPVGLPTLAVADQGQDTAPEASPGNATDGAFTVTFPVSQLPGAPSGDLPPDLPDEPIANPLPAPA